MKGSDVGEINMGHIAVSAVILAIGLFVTGCSISTSKIAFVSSEDSEQAVVMIGIDDVSGQVPPILRMVWRQFDPQTQMPLDENVFVFINTGGARTYQLEEDSTVYAAIVVPPGTYVLESIVSSSRFAVSAYNAQNWMTGGSKIVEIAEGDIAYLGRFVLETSLNGHAVLLDHTQDVQKADQVRILMPDVIGEMTLPPLMPFSYECKRVSWTGVFKRCASPVDAVPKGHVINF